LRPSRSLSSIFSRANRNEIWATFEEGTYANWLYGVIHPHVAKLLVCDQRKNRLDGSRTDKIDAQRLAELLPLNALKAVHGQQNIQPLKELVHSYVSLKKEGTRVMNRLKAIFHGRGIPCCGTSIYQPKNLRLGMEPSFFNSDKISPLLNFSALHMLSTWRTCLLMTSKTLGHYQITSPGWGAVRPDTVPGDGVR
jgi:hypothetical protein